MKSNMFRTLWVYLYSITLTAVPCIRALWRHLRGTMNREWADKVLQNWTSSILSIAGVGYKVVNPHGTAPVPGKPTILICNHSSVYDIPLGYKAFPKHSLRMLAKRELLRVPLFGRAMQSAEFVFIDRKNRQQAMKDLEEAKCLMESGIIMWISPEGTRSRSGKLQPFKKGAFIMAIQANATIIPMGIRGAFNILPPDTILQLNPDQNAEIHIGKAIDAGRYSLKNKDALIQQTWEQVRALVGEVPEKEKPAK